MTIVSHLASMLEAGDAAAFDGFLRASPFGAYQQSRAWPLAAPGHDHRQWRYFLCRQDGALIGAAVIRCTKLPMGFWMASLQRGPVVHDPDQLAAVLGELKRALRRSGCCLVHLGPRVRGRALPAMAEAMRSHGFAPVDARDQALHNVTGIVWLDKPEADILAGFKQRARRALRAAEKAGITIRAVDGPADLDTYQQLLDAFAAARPDYDMSGQPDARGQAVLVESLGGALLLAERNGVPVGAHAFVRQADEAIWLSLATLDREGASPGYPLLWEGMRRARALGCVGYDLAGLPEDEPQDPGEAGRVQFKNGFAPHRRIMPPTQGASFGPVPQSVLLGARRAYRTLQRLRRSAHG
jgi:lipid II:glycine glycyltransferase (peptidoglycan interpeptide bridge formation enzyme)